MSTILVAGATGLVGQSLCQQLRTAGQQVRALVRATSDPAKVAQLKALGVETVQGDVRERASLDNACQGITTVISTVSCMPFSYQPGVNDIQTTDLMGCMNLIEAAKACHVSHFIYTSFSGHMDLDFPLRNAKRAVEHKLKGSGLIYTILRPSYFMEVWLSPAVGFDAANAKAAIYGRGQNPISWIALQDVAKFAAASVDNPAAKDATLELGGPQALSPLQAVKLFEQASGRSFEVQYVSEETLEGQQAGATDPMQKSFSGLMRCYALGDAIDMSTTLKAFPIQLETVEEYVKQVLVPA